jgi:hypothetical protein
MNNHDTISACPVPAHGGLFLRPNGKTTYVTPWHSWWMAKIWHGKLTRSDSGWRETVSRSELERDYIYWARENSDVALYTVPLETALYFPTGLSYDAWQNLMVTIGDLDSLRARWNEHLFKVNWPERLAAVRAITKPVRPRLFSVAPQGELLAA